MRFDFEFTQGPPVNDLLKPQFLHLVLGAVTSSVHARVAGRVQPVDVKCITKSEYSRSCSAKCCCLSPVLIALQFQEQGLEVRWVLARL